MIIGRHAGESFGARLCDHQVLYDLRKKSSRKRNQTLDSSGSPPKESVAAMSTFVDSFAGGLQAGATRGPRAVGGTGHGRIGFQGLLGLIALEAGHSRASPSPPAVAGARHLPENFPWDEHQEWEIDVHDTRKLRKRGKVATGTYHLLSVLTHVQTSRARCIDSPAQIRTLLSAHRESGSIDSYVILRGVSGVAMPSCLPLCGKSSMVVGDRRSGSSVTAEAGEESTPQKEPASWPDAPKGYPPRPPPIDDFVSHEQLQREVSLTERAGDSESQVESPAALRTADSSPAPVSTVEVLEQLANTPDLWKGPIKVDRGNGSSRKPPRAPPVEDTLKTSWSARDRSDR